MAAENSVADIGVKLTADTSSFDRAIKASAGKMQAALGTTKAGNTDTGSTTGNRAAGIGTTTVKAEASFTEAQVGRALRAAMPDSVNVGIKITTKSLNEAKAAITAKIGTIPVTIQPQFSKTGPQSIQNVMGSVLSMQYGISQTQGRALFKETVDKALPAGRAMGGPVAAGQATVVGEKRPEVFRPTVSGRIYPSVDSYQREVSALAGLERQILLRQRNIQSLLSSIPGLMGGGPIHAQNGRPPAGTTALNRYGGQSAMENHIDAVVKRLTGEDVRIGGIWYDAARRIMQRGQGVVGYSGSLDQNLAATAALSPRNLFASNVAQSLALQQAVAGGKRFPHRARATALLPVVRDLIEQEIGSSGLAIPSKSPGIIRRAPHGPLGPGQKAWEILQGGPIGSLLSGPKVVPFNANLGGDLDQLTLDALASQIATGGAYGPTLRAAQASGLGPIHVDSPGEGVFRDAMADAYQEVFRSLPAGLKRRLPHIAQLQAATWVNWRGSGMMGGGPVRHASGGLLARMAAKTPTGPRIPGPMGERFEDLAFGRFGETDDPGKAGWISPSGRFLDFSAGKNVRWLDHRDASQLFPDLTAGGLFSTRDEWDAYEAMMERGFSRIAAFNSDWLGLETMLPFSSSQMRRIGEEARYMMTSAAATDWRDFAGGQKSFYAEGPKRVGAMMREVNDFIAGPQNTTSRRVAEALRAKGFMGGGFARHAGVGSRALKATLAASPMGGTFPVAPGAVVPTSGHALGIPQLLGGETIDVPMDPNNLTTESVRGFLKAFHTQRKLGAPFVGTWLDPDINMISVDPSTVIPRKRDADLVLRAGGEKAAWDIAAGRRGDDGTWYQSGRGVRSSPERILEAVFSGTGLRRQDGGLVRDRRLDPGYVAGNFMASGAHPVSRFARFLTGAGRTHERGFISEGVMGDDPVTAYASQQHPGAVAWGESAAGLAKGRALWHNHPFFAQTPKIGYQFPAVPSSGDLGAASDMGLRNAVVLSPHGDAGVLTIDRLRSNRQVAQWTPQGIAENALRATETFLGGAAPREMLLMMQNPMRYLPHVGWMTNDNFFFPDASTLASNNMTPGGFFQTYMDRFLQGMGASFKHYPDYRDLLAGRQAGGSGSGHGLYVVGEIGKELFVPKTMEQAIPKEVMDQIPKAAGGTQVIGEKRNSLFTPPEDGWIIPNRLLDKVDHLMPGRLGRAEAGMRPRFPGSFSEGPIGWVDSAGQVHSYGTMGYRYGAIMGPESAFDPSLLSQGRPAPANLVGRASEMGLRGEIGITPENAGSFVSNFPTGFFGGTAYDPIEAVANYTPNRGYVAGITDTNRPFGTTFTAGEGRPLPEREMFGREQAVGGDWRPGYNPSIGARGGTGPLTERIQRVELEAEEVRVQTDQGRTMFGSGGNPFAVNPGAAPRGGGRAGLPDDIAEMFASQREEYSFAAQMQAARTPRGLAAVLGTSFLGRTGQLARIAEQRRAATGVQQAAADIFGEQGEAVGRDTIKRLNTLVDERAFLKVTDARQEEIDAVEAQITQLTAGSEANRQYVSRLENFNDKAKEGLPGWRQGIQNLGAATAAVFAFGMATKAVGVATAVASSVAAPFVDQMRGWAAISDKTTTELGKASRAAGGNVDMVIAQRSAQAGLSADNLDYIQSTLGVASAIKAGAQASKDAENLFKAAAGVRQGAPAGLYGGYGGLFQSGLFAELLGGGPGYTQTLAGVAKTYSGGGGFEEQMNSFFNTLGEFADSTIGDAVGGLEYFASDRSRLITDIRRAQSGELPLPQQAVNTGLDVTRQGTQAVGEFFTAPLGVLSRLAGAAADAAGNKELADFLGGLNVTGVFGAAGSAADALVPQGESLEQYNARRVAELRGEYTSELGAARGTQAQTLSLARGNLARGSLRVDAIEGNYDFATSYEEVAEAIRVANENGDTATADLAANTGIIIRAGTEAKTVWDEFSETYRTVVGGVANATEAEMLTAQAAIGAQIPAMEAWVRETQQMFAASLEGIEQQGERARSLIPGELTTQLLASPLITPGIGAFRANTPGAIRAVGATGGNVTAIQGLLGQATAGQAELESIAQAGYEAQLAALQDAWPEGNPLIDEFKTLYDNTDTAALGAKQLSAGIKTTTEDMMAMQQIAMETQWANNIRLATRAVGDAVGLLGEAGGTRLGYLQREQYLAGRASQSLGLASQRIALVSQELSLALQRRQIATQVAVAGFQAPGETGEERFARQREALIRAAIQRRQLGLQGQQLGISQDQYGIATRQFVLAGQIWSENARRGALDARRALRVTQASQNAQLRAIAAQAAIATQQQLLGQRVKRMQNILGESGQVWGQALNRAVAGVGKFTGSVTAASNEILSTVNLYRDSKGNIKGPGLDLGNSASGLVGTTSGETSLTIGEAGKETVAVLRNPRRGSLSSGGGGGGPVNITINISGSKDPDATARAVADEVERRLSRKGEMLGLRGPSY